MSLVHEIDYGTPRSKAGKAVTLTIDGQTVSVPEGTSIMRAAMEVGTKIPKLCATDMLEAFGSCRLCLVEIQGRAGTPASCTGLTDRSRRPYRHANQLPFQIETQIVRLKQDRPSWGRRRSGKSWPGSIRM